MISSICPNCGSFNTDHSYHNCDFLDPKTEQYFDCYECDIVWNARHPDIGDYYADKKGE